MQEFTDLIRVDSQGIVLYDDALARMGEIADTFSETETFEKYHEELRPNTRKKQKEDLKVFSQYLQAAGVTRSPDALYNDAEAWRGMSHGILKGFVEWQMQQGYAIGTIGGRISTIHTYSRLAKEAKVIDEDVYELIMTVQGHQGKKARNLDKSREEKGFPTRMARAKKAHPTQVQTHQALELKKATTTIERKRRPHDEHIKEADALMMGLFIEHALRVGEVADLDVTSIDLHANILTFKREKTDTDDKQTLHKHTRMAAEKYLAHTPATGPLFVGYNGRRLSRRAIQNRVQTLGKQRGIEHLSPHDLRHYWTYDAFMNNNSLDKIVSGGGWTTPTMALRYAKRTGISNEGIKVTEE